MNDVEHKLLDYAQHLGVYVGSVFTVISAGIGLWWHDRKQAKKEVKEIRTLVLHLKGNSATKDDLIECSKEKDAQHHEGIKDVLSELQAVRKENSDNIETNSQQHLDIMREMTRLHVK